MALPRNRMIASQPQDALGISFVRAYLSCTKYTKYTKFIFQLVFKGLLQTWASAQNYTKLHKIRIRIENANCKFGKTERRPLATDRHGFLRIRRGNACLPGREIGNSRSGDNGGIRNPKTAGLVFVRGWGCRRLYAIWPVDHMSPGSPSAVARVASNKKRRLEVSASRACISGGEKYFGLEAILGVKRR